MKLIPQGAKSVTVTKDNITVAWEDEKPDSVYTSREFAEAFTKPAARASNEALAAEDAAREELRQQKMKEAKERTAAVKQRLVELRAKVMARRKKWEEQTGRIRNVR